MASAWFKTEFSKGYLDLKGNKRDFVSSKWLRDKPFLCWRICLALYVNAVNVVLLSSMNFPKILIYLTQWSYILTVSYFTVAAIVCIVHCIRKRNPYRPRSYDMQYFAKSKQLVTIKKIQIGDPETGYYMSESSLDSGIGNEMGTDNRGFKGETVDGNKDEKSTEKDEKTTDVNASARDDPHEKESEENEEKKNAQNENSEDSTDEIAVEINEHEYEEISSTEEINDQEYEEISSTEEINEQEYEEISTTETQGDTAKDQEKPHLLQLPKNMMAIEDTPSPVSTSSTMSTDGSLDVTHRYQLLHRRTGRLPRHIKALWVLYNINCGISVAVSLIYWIFLFRGFHRHTSFLYIFLDINVHALNTILGIADNLLCSIPCHFVHFFYPVLFGVLYIAFTVLYWYAGGHGSIYALLDYDSSPYIAIVMIVVCLVFVLPLAFSLQYLVCKLRDGLLARYNKT